jgi:SAP domain
MSASPRRRRERAFRLARGDFDAAFDSLSAAANERPAARTSTNHPLREAAAGIPVHLPLRPVDQRKRRDAIAAAVQRRNEQEAIVKRDQAEKRATWDAEMVARSTNSSSTRIVEDQDAADRVSAIFKYAFADSNSSTFWHRMDQYGDHVAEAHFGCERATDSETPVARTAPSVTSTATFASPADRGNASAAATSASRKSAPVKRETDVSAPASKTETENKAPAPIPDCNNAAAGRTAATIGAKIIASIVNGVDRVRDAVEEELETQKAAEAKSAAAVPDAAVAAASAAAASKQAKKDKESASAAVENVIGIAADAARPEVPQDLVELVETGTLKKLTVTKLRRLLSTYGLKTVGRKTELINRLTSFVKAQAQ